MKDRPIVIFITLTAGLVACICCIINKAGLVTTLIAVLVSLIVFLIIGMAVNSVIARQSKIAEERAKEERQREEEQREAEGKESKEENAQ